MKLNKGEERPKKLLWLDMEMTGLDPIQDRIIEVAAIITDFDFEELATFSAVIKQPEELIERAAQDPWIQANLTDLLESVAEGEEESVVTGKIIELIDQHFDGPAILAGNSIHQDRRFIRQWWPEVEKRLHYRMLDVSSFKVWMQGAHHTEYEKQKTHRAADDLRESIDELKSYLEKLGKKHLTR